MKIHEKKKHTTIEIERYPRTCDLCDTELRNAAEMKKHIKSHSYKRANYKCDDCDFVGESEFTMEVHIGKFHSEKYECGLCDFEATNLENLEIHLVTCEIYQCDNSKMKFKSMGYQRMKCILPCGSPLGLCFH